jgi:GNAT superfamily N-acetyltransferase
MEATARPADRSDVSIVVELAASAIDELTPHRGGGIWSRLDARTEPLDSGIEAALDSDTDEVVVGMIDDTVVGYGAVTLRPLHDGSTLGDLTDLYVMPGAREVGIGEAMMDEILVWCRARGCVGIDSIAVPGDRATKNFFETFGLVARAIRVHRPLSES